MAPLPPQPTSRIASSERSPSLRLKNASSATRVDQGVISLRYEDTKQAKPPIPVTVPPPRRPPVEKHPALRAESRLGRMSELGSGDGEVRRAGVGRAGDGEGEAVTSKRDSGLAPTMSSQATESSVKTFEESVCGVTINFDASPQTSRTASVAAADVPVTPNKVVKKSASKSDSMSRWISPRSRKDSHSKTSESQVSEEEFSPITTPIPVDGLLEDNFLDQISFSKRGSMMLGGKKAVNGQVQPGVNRQASFSMLATSSFPVLSEDVENDSKKVRSMYEPASGVSWQEAELPVNGASQIEEEDESKSSEPSMPVERPETSLSQHELAGGIEDWEDIDGKDVDRYGFISMRRDVSKRTGSPEPRPPQRVSTVLHLASEMPRQKRPFGRSPSATAYAHAGRKRSPPRRVSVRSNRSQITNNTRRSTSRSTMRAATNRLPGNRNRRWMDEAGDMLTLPPRLAAIAEDEDKAAASVRRKEWNRAEKWRKMAEVVRPSDESVAEGQGMTFVFDTRNPKLIARTWKGIPDRWRAPAWYSFLSTSAAKRKDSAPDEQIIRAFHKLQDHSSADDVQIDLDVPRTINSHIMFRRRYRGGQRLLFRVLHALSLYFPGTGYVQGMASLAATLLCYYDEERTFVMLVRMWTLRGLSRLYEAGFEGLMAALDEFRGLWLEGSDVARQLADFSIEPTAYGTRWYLTLFNYSIPFSAQLRVWDVFMLLGDSDLTPSTPSRPFGGGLDVLHATAAALIDGTREILLESDFENAMKVLTGWIPVKDEDLLMKVARAEWRSKRGRGRKT